MPRCESSFAELETAVDTLSDAHVHPVQASSITCHRDDRVHFHTRRSQVTCAVEGESEYDALLTFF